MIYLQIIFPTCGTFHVFLLAVTQLPLIDILGVKVSIE